MTTTDQINWLRHNYNASRRSSAWEDRFIAQWYLVELDRLTRAD